MSQTVFLRLLQADDKPAALAQAVKRILEGEASPDVHVVDPESFRQVPGTPFAYWVSDRIRRLFKELPPFESNGRQLRLGDHPSDDFRYLRLFWEVTGVSDAPQHSLVNLRCFEFGAFHGSVAPPDGEGNPGRSDIEI
jgi:hypothetical protein